MGTLDIQQRKVAVPFFGHIWGQNQSDLTAVDLNSGFPGDASGLDYVNGLSGSSNASATTFTLGGTYGVAIRVLQPHYGQLIECKLDINMSFASADNGIGFYCAIGTFASMAQTYIQNLSYTQSELDQSWAKINGHNAHLPVTSGSINAKAINLLPALYPYGNANYFEDAFVLLLCFDKQPTLANFIVNWLNIHQSTTGIA